MATPNHPPHMGDKLKAEAAARELSPTQIAKLFGVKPPSVYGWYENGSIDKKHYQKLLDWSGKTIEWWLDLRPLPVATANNQSEFARTLASLFDTLPDNPARNRLFMDLCELIRRADVSAPSAPPTPAPSPFAQLGKTPE